ncbi:helix-turn-helix domain-containing protein [Alphaproteobacteria bacterium]|nr:helix-turn-helix domain-containing protein [Alphaproteobacteria bacterium]
MVLIAQNQSLKKAKTDFENAYIRQAIEANDCRLRKAAEALDIHYSALITKMKRNGIKVKPQMEVSNGL